MGFQLPDCHGCRFVSAYDPGRRDAAYYCHHPITLAAYAAARSAVRDLIGRDTFDVSMPTLAYQREATGCNPDDGDFVAPGWCRWREGADDAALLIDAAADYSLGSAVVADLNFSYRSTP